MDNALIKKYTDAVYWEYQIRKPFFYGENYQENKRNNSFKEKCGNTEGCQVFKNLGNCQKKLIELKIGKNNLKATKLQGQPIRYSNSNSSKISHTSTINPRLTMRQKHQFSQPSDYTPDRRTLTKTKNRLNSTIACTIFNKSSNQNGFNPKNQHHHFGSSQKQKKNYPTQEEIYVSEFDQGSVCSQTNSNFGNSQPDHKEKQTIKLKTKNKKAVINEIIDSERKQKCVYCPICQSVLTKQSIQQHEQLCQQLQQLYSLSVPKLIQFISWKVEQHQSSICKQISNIGDDLISNKLQNPNKYSQGREKCIKNTIEQCQQQVKKCLWFQQIKAQLIVKSQQLL